MEFNIPLFTLDLGVMGPAIFLLSAVITLFMIHLGIKDVPIGRSSHQSPTPKSGGVAIVVGFLSAMAYLYLSHHIGYIPEWRLVLLGISALITVTASLRDDIKGLSAAQKFFIQVTAACLVVGSDLSLKILPFPMVGSLNLGALGGVISALWIIFFMNVFNFMDGLNGLTSGVSLVASIFCSIIGFMLGEKALFYVSFSLFWATLGFFIFNFPKAKIFMGDVGSQFLGLIWAVLLLIPSQETHVSSMTLSIFTVPLLFFGFIYDVSFTILRRIWNREPFWKAHRTHLFQLLNRLHYSHSQVTCFYLFLAMIQGVGAIVMQYVTPSRQILMFIPYLGVMISYHYWIYTRLNDQLLSKSKRVLK